LNLYVKNLDDDVTDAALEAMFSEFGIITSAAVMKSDNGVSRCFGFVCFENEADAEKALVGMRTKSIGKKPLFVARAQRREERRIQLENEFQTSMVQRMQYSQLFYPPTVPIPQPGMFYSPMYRRFPVPMQIRGGYQGGNVGTFNGQAKRGRGYYVQQSRVGGNNNGPSQNRQNTRPRVNQQRNHLPPATAAPIIPQSSQGKDLASILASETSLERQKNILGERLFPLIQKDHGEIAGKITGMLLEMDVSEILNLVESSNERQAKINEALEVLNSK